MDELARYSPAMDFILAKGRRHRLRRQPKSGMPIRASTRIRAGPVFGRHEGDERGSGNRQVFRRFSALLTVRWGAVVSRAM